MTLFLLAILLGVLVRLALYRNLVFPSIAFPWMFFLGLGWELAWTLLALLQLVPPQVAGPVGQTGTYLLLALAFAIQARIPAFTPAILGALLNAAVILANGGHMPVDPKALEQAGLGHLLPFLVEARDGVHTLMDTSTRLRYLGDWIAIPPLGKVVSPGDILLVLSLFLVPIFPHRRPKAASEKA